MKKLFSLFIIILFLFAGCKESNKTTPTKGTVLVEVDPSVAPIVIKESAVFDSLYNKAKINLKMVPPLTGIVDIINGKVKMYVTPRYLNKKEIDFINKQKLNINTYKFCYTAVVLIESKENKLEHIRVDEIKDALMGKPSNVSFIIPSNNSETYQYLKEEVLDGKDPKTAEIDSSEENIIKTIKNGSNKIGIVSFNLVQDSSKLNFVQIGQLEKSVDSTTKSGDLNVDYYSPHPGYVFKGLYPLKQTIYIYLNELEMTPASGFTTFLTSYEGQKIALQQNLAPAAVPVKINQYQ
jgi:ABC-type phosphate transport system substrate-binding protein